MNWNDGNVEGYLPTYSACLSNHLTQAKAIYKHNKMFLSHIKHTYFSQVYHVIGHQIYDGIQHSTLHSHNIAQRSFLNFIERIVADGAYPNGNLISNSLTIRLLFSKVALSLLLRNAETNTF